MLGYDSYLTDDVEGRSGGQDVLWKHGSNCMAVNYSQNFINLIVEDHSRGRFTCYYK